MNFVEITFKDETSRARWCDEKCRYVRDEVMMVSSVGSPSEVKLHPGRTWYLSFEEMMRDSRYTVTGITEEEYWKDANQRLANYFEGEIEQMQNELNDKMTKLNAFKSSVGLA